MKTESLSDKITEALHSDMLFASDVKEAVKKLKEGQSDDLLWIEKHLECNFKGQNIKDYITKERARIDKIFGDKLI